MIYSKHATTWYRTISHLTALLHWHMIKRLKRFNSKSIKEQFPSVAEVIKDTFVVLSLDGIVITVGHTHN